MGKKICGGWRKRQSDAVSETEEGFGGEGVKKNLYYQEADNTAKYHPTSGFLSKHFTWQVMHTSAGTEKKMISLQWSHSHGAAFSEHFAAGEVTKVLDNGDVHIQAKRVCESSQTFGSGHSAFALPPFLK